MTRFLHNTNFGSLMKIGNSQSTKNWESNHYWLGSLNGNERKLSTKKLSELNVPEEMIHNIVKKHQYGDYATTLLRELIFEEVRNLNFPSLPSRKKCIYLFNYEDVPFTNLVQTLKRMNLIQGKLFEVHVDPNKACLHTADAVWLDGIFLKYEEMRERAQDYWLGKLTSDPKVEVLLEGEYIVAQERNWNYLE